MFHFKKTLWERFKNTVGAIQKHWGSDETLPQCLKKWNMKLKMKHETKNETLNPYVSSLECFDNQQVET